MTDLKAGSSPLSALDWRYQAIARIEPRTGSLWHSGRIVGNVKATRLSALVDSAMELRSHDLH
ncbi:MAG: hypothetical protein QOH35_4850 [Acidobacteriaceae bacterium]|jgi:hypothetical protein|nr:hypothetical protein [Acidobacteriaceae bacterium]